MSTSPNNGGESLHHWIVVRPEPEGQFTAHLLGLPELCATAARREDAIEQVRVRIAEWVVKGQLVSINTLKDRWRSYTAWKDPNDPEEQLFLAELARMKAEDLEQTLREHAEENEKCSNTSSTPTT